MTLEHAIVAAQVFFLLYFLGLNGMYLLLNIMALPQVWNTLRIRSLDYLPQIYAGFEPPISILAPAYNEEATIAASVRSLLQLAYPEYEVVIINDGSKDGTLEVLRREFDLVPLHETFPARLETKEIRNLYGSLQHSNLRVIDKENGGKSDALNAGINVARYPLFCCMDADSILQRDSLTRIVRPFLEDPTMIACGGTIRIANGCKVQGGFLVEAGLPKNPLALFQIMEYLRAFLFGRMGWVPFNAVLIISGAFGVMKKDVVLEAGGYRTDTVGEDMELIARLHRIMRQKGVPYRIAFVPDPICWTEAPEDLKTLRNQRIRWQRGLGEALSLNRWLLFNPKAGAAGWLAYPFMYLFELFGPIIELCGYLFMIFCFVMGIGSMAAWYAFILLAFGFGILLSISALLLEELSFHLYPRFNHLVLLTLAAIGENLGYRQLNSWWRLVGVIRWLRGAPAQWGSMTRRAAWAGQMEETGADRAEGSHAVRLEETPVGK